MAACLAMLPAPQSAHSFCGFYVAKGDAKLFNNSSQVVLVRDGDRTVLTMMSDYQGDPKEFAVVIPVPSVIQKSQVHIGDPAVVDHLDAFSAPRLVEYTDPNPCPSADRRVYEMSMAPGAVAQSGGLHFRGGRKGEVKIEASYTVGEYDILILSAKSSSGLERWLIDNGYRIPEGANAVLASYLKQNMRFFVAKVNLAEQRKLNLTKLRPIQVAFESAKFVLPLRLGMVNSTGTQDLFVYGITKRGRIEAVNYRTVKLPSDVDVPEYVKDVFPDFHRAMFAEQWRKNGRDVVLTEHAWDMASCDPCPSEPLSHAELRALGVWWVPADAPYLSQGETFLTRLHVRYDRAHFPEDLVLQETADRENWQARYVVHHPYAGTEDCPAVAAYRRQVRERREKEARNLADLTGWRIEDVRTRMSVNDVWSRPEENLTWWERLWGK